MLKKLSWYVQEKTLILYGELDRDTLLILWKERKVVLKGIQFLDVFNLNRIDSAGVALILHLYHYQKQRGNTLMLTGVTDNLRTLIKLYKLQTILPV